jgi:hypothetical protein
MRRSGHFLVVGCFSTRSLSVSERRVSKYSTVCTGTGGELHDVRAASDSVTPAADCHVTQKTLT